MLINHARPIMFSIAPSFLLCAAARVGYEMLRTGKTAEVSSLSSTSSSSSYLTLS